MFEPKIIMDNPHIKSEWILGDENNSHVEIIVGDMSVDMCRFDRWTEKEVMSRQEMLEVAQLIIAAPKLLEACQETLKGFSLLIAANDLTEDEKRQVLLLQNAISLATRK